MVPFSNRAGCHPRWRHTDWGARYVPLVNSTLVKSRQSALHAEMEVTHVRNITGRACKDKKKSRKLELTSSCGAATESAGFQVGMVWGYRCPRSSHARGTPAQFRLCHIPLRAASLFACARDTRAAGDAGCRLGNSVSKFPALRSFTGLGLARMLSFGSRGSTEVKGFSRIVWRDCKPRRLS